MKNKYKGSKYKVLMSIVTVSIFAALLFGCGAKEDLSVVVPVEESPAVEEEKVEATAEPTEIPTNSFSFIEVVAGQIETPYGVLNYNESLSDNLLVANTEETPYTLEFYALLEGNPEVRLFDISLGEGANGNVGMANTTHGVVPMSVTIYELNLDESWEEGEILTLQAMQDVVNDLITQLISEKSAVDDFSPEVAIQPEEASMESVFVETPLCTMYYPARWTNSLNIVHDDSLEYVYKVHFYGLVENMPEQLLFSIYFGGDEGEQLGAIMNSEGIPVPVYIIMYELDLSGWYEEPASMLYSMQEASNKLIEKLPLLQ
jgi:hypothetical protein